MASVSCRRANIRDCSAILDLDPEGSIYDGADYLPTWLTVYMQDPSYNHFVLEVNGRIVCYTIWNIIREGTAVITMATRTHPDFMGRGYVQILMDYATTEMKTKFPRLQEKVTCSLTQHGLRPGSRPVFQENVVGQECLPQTLLEGLAKMADTQRPNTQHLNLCQSLDLLQDDGIIQRFFSFPYILAHPPWLPVLPDKTSLRRLALCHDVIATFHSDVNSECCTDISYALVLKGTKVLAIEIFYYGNNMSVLETHTLMHVKRFTKHLCDGKRPSLFIHYRHSADHLTPGVEDFFLRLLGQPGKRWDATIAAASI